MKINSAKRGRRGAVLALGLLLSGSGCSGPQQETARLAPAPLVRLSPEQYENAVLDLLGVSYFPDKGQIEESLDREGVPTHPAAGLADARSYLGSAESIAQSARESGVLAMLAPCGDAADEACAERFVTSFGRRAFRRPLTEAELATLRGVYSKARMSADAGGLGLSYLDAVQVTLESILNLPQFLYVLETGTWNEQAGAGAVVPLTPYEIATRLSLFLWQSVPDEALLKAAEEGRLSTLAGMADEVKRMLGGPGRPQPHAERGVRAFMQRWMSLADAARVRKSTALFPGFDDATRESLGEETKRFASHVIFEDDGRLDTLLTAPYSFVNLPLANIYGLDKSRLDGRTFVKVALDPTQRAGLLTQPSLLAARAHSADVSPTLRGFFVRQRLMCEFLAPPPPSADTTPPATDFSVPTRERYKEHSSNPECAGCHVRMDPVGAGFDRYDASGAFRKYVGKFEIDPTGQIYGSTDLDGPFTGPVELAKRLAASPTAQDCFVRQVYRFAHGRHEDPERDRRSLDSIRAGFGESGRDIRRLLAEIALSESFRFRRIGEGEAQP